MPPATEPGLEHHTKSVSCSINSKALGDGLQCVLDALVAVGVVRLQGQIKGASGNACRERGRKTKTHRCDNSTPNQCQSIQSSEIQNNMLGPPLPSTVHSCSTGASTASKTPNSRLRLAGLGVLPVMSAEPRESCARLTRTVAPHTPIVWASCVGSESCARLDKG